MCLYNQRKSGTYFEREYVLGEMRAQTDKRSGEPFYSGTQIPLRK